MTSIFALSTGTLLLLANILHASDRMISMKKMFTKELNNQMHVIQGQIKSLEGIIKQHPSLTKFKADVENFNGIATWAMDEAEDLNTLVQVLPGALPEGTGDEQKNEDDYIQGRVQILWDWCK